MTNAALLDPDEPDPVNFDNEASGSVFFLTCDHAGRLIPRSLGRLGLPEAETFRHIAWDIGIGAVGQQLSRHLDATIIRQTYSRLVIDCNRDPTVPSSIPEISETTEIPGNCGITPADRAARISAIFRPYHDRIAAALDRRAAEGRASLLVALHSFTPVFKGVSRPWHGAVLFNRDRRFAHILAGLLRAERGLVIGEKRALRSNRPDRLHRPSACRTPRAALRRDRDPPGFDRGPGRASCLGRASGASAADRLHRVLTHLKLA